MEETKYYCNPTKKEIARLCEVISSFGITSKQEAERFEETMKPSKPSKACGSEYAWALYIKTGANKEGTFDEYMKYNKIINPNEWEMLNRTYKQN